MEHCSLQFDWIVIGLHESVDILYFVDSVTHRTESVEQRILKISHPPQDCRIRTREFRCTPSHSTSKITGFPLVIRSASFGNSSPNELVVSLPGHILQFLQIRHLVIFKD